MRTKQLVLLLLSFSIFSCDSYQHLNDESEFITSEHGSFITVWVDANADGSEIEELQGELIAVDTDSLYLLSEGSDGYTSCVGVSSGQLNSYTLYYAKPNTSFWTIPGFTLFSVSHGLFAVLTGPLNFFVTSLTQSYIVRKSQSQEEDLTLMELAPFARFPRGLPDGVNPSQIK